MSLFSSPKPQRPPPQANAPVQAEATPTTEDERPTGAGSLISTGAAGLSRKPRTQKTSLIGGN